MGRRDINDKEWQAVKRRVKARDNNRDRMQFVLSLAEYKTLRSNAGPYISKIDPAHVISVSKNYSRCYEEDNIISLNRYSHSNLDSCKDPVTGENISGEEVTSWWIRLLKACPSQWESFTLKKYDEELEK